MRSSSEFKLFQMVFVALLSAEVVGWSFAEAAVAASSLSPHPTLPLTQQSSIRKQRTTDATTTNRILNGGDTDPENIFDNLRSNSNSSSSLSLNNELCVRPDANGDYGAASTPYTDTAMVVFTYHVQGLIDMTATTVREHVLPQIETELSARLVEMLFAPVQVCTDADDDGMEEGTGQQGKQTGGQRQRMRLLQPQQFTSTDRSLTELPAVPLDNGASLTGLLQAPRDTIMNGHEGVLCQNAQYFQEAKRCYKVIGGVSIVGQNGSVDQAVQRVQNTIQTLLNDQHVLDNVHPSLINVQYVAPQEDYHEYFGKSLETSPNTEQPPQPNSDPSPTNNESKDDGRDWPIWPLVVVGGCLLISCLGFCLWRQKSQKGSFVRSVVLGPSHRLLKLASSSDDSGISDSSGESMDQYQHHQPISNTWRKMPNLPPSKSEDEEPIVSSLLSVDSGDAATTKSRESYYFDNKTTEAQGLSIMKGSFPEASQQSGLVFSDQVENYNASEYASSRGSETTDGTSGDEEDDDGSSSPSDTSTPPPPRAWRRSVI